MESEYEEFDRPWYRHFGLGRPGTTLQSAKERWQEFQETGKDPCLGTLPWSAPIVRMPDEEVQVGWASRWFLATLWLQRFQDAYRAGELDQDFFQYFHVGGEQ